MLLVSRNAFAMSVSVTNASGYPGDRGVPVSINVSSLAPNITGIDLQLQYNAAELEIAEVQKGSLTSEWNLTANTNVSGILNIALFGANPLPYETGNIAVINFNVKDTASPGAIHSLYLNKVKFNEQLVEAVNNGVFNIISSEKIIPLPETTTQPDSRSSIVSQVELVEKPAQEELIEPKQESVQKKTIAGIYYRRGAVREGHPEVVQNIENLEPKSMYYEENAPQAITQAEETATTPIAQPLIAEQAQAQKTKLPPTIEEKIESKIPSEPSIPAATVRLKKIKDILGLWKVYKLVLEGNIKVQSWRLAEGQNLPGILQLNSKEGTIYGFAPFIDKKETVLKLIIITKDWDKIETECLLKFD